MFLSLWEAGVTYLLLHSGIIFHPSISCWGLNGGDEYTAISLIMIKAFKVQVLEDILETRKELRHLQGCWFKPRRSARAPLPFFWALWRAAASAPTQSPLPCTPPKPSGEFLALHLHWHLFMCTSSSFDQVLIPSWKSKCVSQLLFSYISNGKAELELDDKTL